MGKSNKKKKSLIIFEFYYFYLDYYSSYIQRIYDMLLIR